jgi:hypothetical protein
MAATMNDSFCTLFRLFGTGMKTGISGRVIGSFSDEDSLTR